ncbi:MAG: amidohydrolase family protein, partial [Fidelibacterota bacterium]
DLALDEESVLASFESGLLSALKAGVTTVIDHHSSQNFIPGSLDLLATCARRVGINISLCFEITDRNGPERFQNGLEENLRATQQYDNDPHIRPLIGLHASFTLSDASLAQIREAINEIDGWGVHVHVSEDVSDETDARGKGYSSVVQRLDSYGLLNNNSILAHGLHILPEDCRTIRESGAALVHNPTSNANNRVGVLPSDLIHSLHPGLGTDGMQSSMLAEAKEGMLVRSSHLPGDQKNPDYLELLFRRNSEIATRLFGRPIGMIEPGYQADLAVYDYHPRTELSSSNIRGHILYGLAQPCHVLTRGEFRVRDYCVTPVDEEEATARARAESTRLWAAMQKI